MSRYWRSVKIRVKTTSPRNVAQQIREHHQNWYGREEYNRGFVGSPKLHLQQSCFRITMSYHEFWDHWAAASTFHPGKVSDITLKFVAASRPTREANACLGIQKTLPWLACMYVHADGMHWIAARSYCTTIIQSQHLDSYDYNENETLFLTLKDPKRSNMSCNT